MNSLLKLIRMLQQIDIDMNWDDMSNLPHTLVFKVGGIFKATNANTFAGFSVRCCPEKVDELRARYPTVKEPFQKT